ncbi:hypothetical protein ILYODFUR_006616 [Ilyodon furcidens]|uniref:Uncharacterized protein n=1 Tax=Ilyodon furcidens TaxID=33524 RepID=A0ABV0VD67_9TELE
MSHHKDASRTWSTTATFLELSYPRTKDPIRSVLPEIKRIFWSFVDSCLAHIVSSLWKSPCWDAASLHSCCHHSFPYCGLALLPCQ